MIQGSTLAARAVSLAALCHTSSECKTDENAVLFPRVKNQSLPMIVQT